MIDYKAARKNMVECQLRPNRITDPRLIQAFEEIPREKFVIDAQKPFAYQDNHIPLDPSHIMISPLTAAVLLQAAHIEDHDSVLIIGSNLGYLAAIVAKLAGSVVALDDNPDHSATSEKNLNALDIHNVTITTSNLNQGCPKLAPYTLILIEGSIDFIPTDILDQLAENGRLLAAVRTKSGRSELTHYVKIKGQISGKALNTLMAPPLPDFIQQPQFVF